MIKLILFDIDGVLTDGTATYDSEGVAVGKNFNHKDISALRRFQPELGINVALCTCSKEINLNYANRKNLSCYYIPYNPGRTEKQHLLPEIIARYNYDLDEIGVVGDDIQDVEIMKLVGYRWCPKDAISDVQILCETQNRLNIKGGRGVANYLFQQLASKY